MAAVGGPGGLNLIPQRFIDNGLMLAGIGLVLVDHLAPVEAIVEQVIQRPAVERTASAGKGPGNRAC